MKKRLLITSIVMMLVVAVALSTATYAWFTSNASVSAQSITMYAAVNSAASIGISWTDSDYGTSITAVSPSSSTKFEPTAINSITANTPLANISWTSSTIKDQGGIATFNGGVVTAAGSGSTDALCYTWNDGTGSGANHRDFFIHNGSDTNTLSSITATVTVTGEAAAFIRVAFFKYDPASGQQVFKLKGVIVDGYVYTEASGTSENGVKYYDLNGDEKQTGDGTTAIGANLFTRAANSSQTAAVGTVSEDEQVGTAITNTNIGTSVDLGGLGVSSSANTDDSMNIKVLVWMDGSALTDATAGTTSKTASVVLHFDATRGAYTADTFGAQAQQNP